MSDHSSAVAHHFSDMEQQQSSCVLGMWVFLLQEVLFFGGLFTAFAVYRTTYLEGFEHASALLDWRIGAVNTAVLLASSLTMALAVRSGKLGEMKKVVTFIGLTILLGTAFLVVKTFEYKAKYDHGRVGLRASGTAST